jgi:glycopeptide antibiotics resistance protein
MFLKHTKWSILWALIILVLCGIPGKDIPHISFLELLSFDKLVHAGIFFVLIVLTIRGLLLQNSFTTIQLTAKKTAFISCVVYGGALEIMQGTIFEQRSADVFDFIANTVGCIIGWLLYEKIEKTILVRIIK